MKASTNALSAPSFIAFVLVSFGFVPAVGADTLLGVTFGPNNLTSKLIAINTATGAGTFIGILDDSIPSDIASRDGKIFVYDQVANLLKEIDPLTAATKDAFSLGINISAEGGMTFRHDGLGFLSNGGPGDSTALFSFDVTADSSSPITGTGGFNPAIDGLAFSPSGVLFGLAQDFAALYMIDQATGATNLVGSLGIPKHLGLGGLAFRSDGTLFGVVDDNLYTIDAVTGIASLVGPIGFDDISGIAFTGPSESPAEPEHPATGQITSSDYPNFRFWVRISDTRTGTEVLDCLSETVCVAGAIPTRAEILIRIVGPKPNGYLWPNVVKFNTTKTEVWIQQISTGTTKYYSFPALAQGSTTLPGLIDKTGFLP